MQFCQFHWDELRKAIEIRGLSHLVARSGQEAAQHEVDVLGGMLNPKDYDPLMACHWMIASKATEVLGLYLLTGDYCPVCEVLKQMERCTCEKCRAASADERAEAKARHERNYIDGPADEALRRSRELGLVPDIRA